MVGPESSQPSRQHRQWRGFDGTDEYDPVLAERPLHLTISQRRPRESKSHVKRDGENGSGDDLAAPHLKKKELSLNAAGEEKVVRGRINASHRLALSAPELPSGASPSERLPSSSQSQSGRLMPNDYPGAGRQATH